MSVLTRQRDIYLPRQPKGMGKGLVLALIVHAALIVALSFSVNWHASDPVGMDAELWAAVPQVAAPRAVEPEPQPEPPKPPPKVEPTPVKTPDADIALEREKREKEKLKLAEKEKEEEERLKKAQADKLKREEADKAKREEQRVAVLREANLKRMMGQAGATGEPTSTGTAARNSGPSAGYAGRIALRVKSNLEFAVSSIEGNPEARVEIRVSPTGTIIARRLTKSSGIPAYDEAILRAVDKTGVLPIDDNGRVPPVMDLGFKPHD